MVALEDFQLLKKEVDTLQVAHRAEEKAWWRKPSILVAAMAFAFSLGTTSFSYYTAHKAEMRDNRAEARVLMQRLFKLPIENFELMQRYGEGAFGQNLAGYVNGENVLLAGQTVELIERFPDSFTSAEYSSVSMALINSGLTENVDWLLSQAFARAETANDHIVAARQIGAMAYQRGDAATGEAYFTLALRAAERYPLMNQAVEDFFNAQTLIAWATLGIGMRDATLAHEKLQMATALVNRLPPGPQTQSYLAQIAMAQANLNQIVAYN